MARVPILAALFIAAVAVAVPAHPLIERAARHFGFISAPPALTVGERFSGLAVNDINGLPVTLNAPTGRTEVINVFATWCVECKKEIPRLTNLAPALSRKNVDLIGIDQQESSDQVARFASFYGIKYPVYIDSSGTTRQRLGARFIPTTIVIGPDGVIRFTRVGPLSDGDLFAMINAALSRERTAYTALEH